VAKPITPSPVLAVPVGVVTVTAAADALAVDSEMLVGLLLIGPVLAAALHGPAGTGLVGLYATGLSVILGIPNEHMGEPQHLVRVGTVLAVGVLAVGAAGWRRRVDGERERLLEALRVSNDARDYVLATTSHDLRSPLTVVAGAAELLGQKGRSLSTHDRALLLSGIERQASRMLRLVDDLLLAWRLEAGTLEVRVRPVEVAQAARAAVQAVGRGPGIEVRCPPGLRVVADPDRLEQILTNLTGNALKYGARPIEIEAAKAPGAVEVRVIDSGPGVAPDFVPYLFERYRRAALDSRPDAGGSGLGLSIVRDLTRAQGGDAWYEPRSGQGAVFVVRLPAVEASARAN